MASDIDNVICYYGGPLDGDVVQLPPDYRTLPIEDFDATRLPPYLDIESGGRYVLSAALKRYEWDG